ncbi:MAG: hypothetical protein WBA46_06365 [Thermomicrobiales bacterium]
MSNRIHKSIVVWGRPGFSSGYVTHPEMTGAIIGLAPSGAGYITRTAEPGLSGETALSSMGPGLLKVGDHDGTLGIAGGGDLPAHTHSGVVFGVAIPIDGGGSAITSGIKAIGIYVPFACAIYGFVVDASTSSTLALTVLRAAAATPTTYTAISAGSSPDKPALNSQQTNSRTSGLANWTTTLAAGDRLRLDADASPTPTAVMATITLLVTRSI